MRIDKNTHNFCVHWERKRVKSSMAPWCASSQTLNLCGLFFQSIAPNAEIRRRRGEDDTSLLQQRRQGGSRRPRRGPRGISDIMVMNSADVVVLPLGRCDECCMCGSRFFFYHSLQPPPCTSSG